MYSILGRLLICDAAENVFCATTSPFENLPEFRGDPRRFWVVSTGSEDDAVNRGAGPELEESARDTAAAGKGLGIRVAMRRG